MKTLSPDLLAHYASGTTTLATCWKVTRTDGVVLTTTAHDTDIPSDGLLYASISAYTMSDQQQQSDLTPDNFELQGFLVSPAITLADVHAGLWDSAVVEMFEVNFADPAMGRNILLTGTLGEVKVTRGKFTAEARGLAQNLIRRVVRIINATCDADLGDARCTINLASFRVSGTVTDVLLDNGLKAAVFGTQPDHYFQAGLLTIVTGANAGLSMEVKEHGQAETYITLVHPLPFTLVVGDTFTITPGCHKRFTEDCVGKFNNGVNFRGFPDIPGTAAFNGPNS